MKEGESADIFTDPIYYGSKAFRLSSSNLFPGEFITGTGFGCGMPDGYGINYAIAKDKVKLAN